MDNPPSQYHGAHDGIPRATRQYRQYRQCYTARPIKIWPEAALPAPRTIFDTHAHIVQSGNHLSRRHRLENDGLTPPSAPNRQPARPAIAGTATADPRLAARTCLAILPNTAKSHPTRTRLAQPLCFDAAVPGSFELAPVEHTRRCAGRPALY